MLNEQTSAESNVYPTITPRQVGRKSKKKPLSRIFDQTGYRLKRCGRVVQMVPWCAVTTPPWRSGYARVFIPYTPEELRTRRDSKRGHEQIVKASNLVRF